MFLKISKNSQESNFARVSFLLKLRADACEFIKKEALAQVFSGEFFKDIFFIEHLRWLVFFYFDSAEMTALIFLKATGL